MLRANALKRMRLRVSAYAKPNAAGIVISVTSADTHTLFHNDSSSAGVLA